MQNKKIIIGNWKMNPESLRTAKEIVLGIKKTALSAKNVTTVLCPPVIYISEAGRMFRSEKLKLGAQDAYFEKTGAFTGQVSPLMLKDAGATYLIVGHSERRKEGESNELVNKKTKAALAIGYNIIFCVGEKQRDEHGFYLSAVQEQLMLGLKGVQKKDVSRLIIAYEPVWAISSQSLRPALPQEIEEMMLYIRKVLVSIFGKNVAPKMRLVYGGTVNPKDAANILALPHVDGLLVGHESLNPKHFSEIIKIADNSAK